MTKSTTNPLMATIDHLYSRFNLSRWTIRKPGEVRKVLACYECNHKRASAEEAAQGKEELFRRGHGFAFNKNPNNGKVIIKAPLESLDSVVDLLSQFGNISVGEKEGNKDCV